MVAGAQIELPSVAAHIRHPTDSTTTEAASLFCGRERAHRTVPRLLRESAPVRRRASATDPTRRPRPAHDVRGAARPSAVTRSSRPRRSSWVTPAATINGGHGGLQASARSQPRSRARLRQSARLAAAPDVATSRHAGAIGFAKLRRTVAPLRPAAARDEPRSSTVVYDAVQLRGVIVGRVQD